MIGYKLRFQPGGRLMKKKPKKITHYAITVLCEDRVGLVARFTGAITRLGGNIEDLEQSVPVRLFHHYAHGRI